MLARHLLGLCMVVSVSVCHTKSFLVETQGKGSEGKTEAEAGSDYYNEDYEDYAGSTSRKNIKTGI